METKEYLEQIKNEINQLNAEIQRLEKEQQAGGLDEKAKHTAQSALDNAKGVLSGVKNKYDEYNLKRNLAVEEVKSGLEMARNDLKETFNSVKSLLQ